MKRVALGALIFLTTTPARAYRPFDSTDASVTEQGDLELELGPVGYVRADHKSHFAPMEVINFGIFDRWELVLQGREILPPQVSATSMSEPPAKRGASTLASRIGLVDTGAFVKTVLREGTLQERTGLSIATELGPWLPEANDEPGVGFSASLLFSNRFSLATFHLNVQGARTRAGNPDLFVGTIAEGPYTWRVRPVAEVFVDRELGAHVTFSALGGMIARVTSELAVDAGARLASMDGAPVVEARAGFTWAIPVSR